MARRKTWNYLTQIAGAYYRIENLQDCYEGQKVILKRNPNNPHDKNAIEMWAGRKHIGFVPADEAVRLSWAIDRGDKVEAHIEKLWLNWENPNHIENALVRLKRWAFDL